MSIRQRNAHFTDWAAVCRALNVATESEARTALESSDNTFYYYVCYIKSTKEIYTHGQFYKCSGNNEELLNLINELTDEVSENEEVTAKALSDLNENKASRWEIPTKISQLTNDSNYITKVTSDMISAMGFTKNEGTITEVKMNGVSKGTSGVVDLGDVQTSISDLETIRDGASKGATALQSVPEEYVKDAQLKKVSDAVDILNSEIGSLYENKQNIISDLDTIREGAAKGATSVQPSDINEFLTVDDLARVSTSGSYNDLTDKPTIPSEITESTVSDWGFTKNLGTVINVKINGITKTPTNGTIDLGTVLTSYTPMTLNTSTIAPTVLRLTPNQKYAYTAAVSSSAIFNLNVSNLSSTKDNTWCLSFLTGTSAPTISFTISQSEYTIMWANGVAPTFEPNTFYEISIKLVGTYLLGVCGAFKTV